MLIPRLPGLPGCKHEQKVQKPAVVRQG